MIAVILPEAEDDIEHAFADYQERRAGLGLELLDEYRRAVERILQFPGAWQPLDETYRRCRLHRFPYGVVYRVEAEKDQILIVAFMHLSRNPGWWRDRT